MFQAPNGAHLYAKYFLAAFSTTLNLNNLLWSQKPEFDGNNQMGGLTRIFSSGRSTPCSTATSPTMSWSSNLPFSVVTLKADFFLLLNQVLTPFFNSGVLVNNIDDVGLTRNLMHMSGKHAYQTWNLVGIAKSTQQHPIDDETGQ